VGQIKIRRTSADLPVFDEGVDLEPVSSLGADGSSVSGFDFGAASVRALDVKGVRLFDGKIRAVRAEHASVTAVHVRSVEFTGCKLDYAVLDQVRAAGPVIFEHCSLREAEFTGCILPGSLFDDCDLTLADFGPGNYLRCDLRGNDVSAVTGTHNLKRVILDRAQLLQLAEALAAEMDVTFGEDLPEEPGGSLSERAA
jgi:uncharacterized protein YjbI with pentapeptide repeats